MHVMHSRHARHVIHGLRGVTWASGVELRAFADGLAAELHVHGGYAVMAVAGGREELAADVRCIARTVGQGEVAISCWDVCDATVTCYVKVYDVGRFDGSVRRVLVGLVGHVNKL